jgi:hypothetical protein
MRAVTSAGRTRAPRLTGVLRSDELLVALGLKKTLEHVEDPLEVEIAVAMLGRIALYLFAHIVFRCQLASEAAAD